MTTIITIPFGISPESHSSDVSTRIGTVAQSMRQGGTFNLLLAHAETTRRLGRWDDRSDLRFGTLGDD